MCDTSPLTRKKLRAISNQKLEILGLEFRGQGMLFTQNDHAV